MSQENIETIRGMYQRWLQNDASLFDAFDERSSCTPTLLPIRLESTTSTAATMVSAATKSAQPCSRAGETAQVACLLRRRGGLMPYCRAHHSLAPGWRRTA